MKKTFLDTNVVVYANDTRDERKQAIALDRVTGAMRGGYGVISTQVLGEYAVVATSKLGQDREVVMKQLSLLESLEVVQITPEIVKRSLEIQARYAIAFWDAQILATAEQARCELLLSEDLNAGQLYGTVRVENPF